MALTEAAERCISTDLETERYWDKCDIEVIADEEVKSNCSVGLSKEKENVVKKKNFNSFKSNF